MIVDLELKHALFVCRNMRASDRLLLEAVRFDTDADNYARERFSVYGVRCAALAADGTPVGMGGMTLASPGVWTCWVIGTERWPERIVEIRRYCGALTAHMLAADTAHRIQAQALKTDAMANRFLVSLGFRREGTMRAAGRNGEDFTFYGKTGGKYGRRKQQR